MTKFVIAAAASVALAFPSIAGAFEVQPSVYDPGNTGFAVSGWYSKTGLNDGVSNSSDYGLVMQKNAPTSANVAAVATITGRATAPLTSLGYDIKGYCGAGSPRYNVTSGSKTWFFGCIYGTHTALSTPGWQHVSFALSDGVPAGPYGPLTATTPVDGIQVVADEQGQSVLDNFLVDGATRGVPSCKILLFGLAGLQPNPSTVCI